MADDPLDVETSLEVALTETGVQGKAKSRTIAALDRLLGNGIDLANLFIEQSTQVKREALKTKQAVAAATRALVVKQIQTDDPRVRYLIEQHLNDTFVKLTNKTGVVTEAMSELKRLQPIENASDSNIRNEPETLDDDWLASFGNYAEQATSEQMRQLFGRILAGEIKRPGAFSRTTLRVAAELEHETARDFEALARLRQGGSVPRETGPGDLPKLLGLEAAGLISYSSTLASRFAANNGNPVDIVLFPYALRVTVKNPGQSWNVPCCVLTKPGRELAELIPNDALEALEKLVKIGFEQLRHAVIYKLTKTPNGTIEGTLYRELIADTNITEENTPFG